MSQFPSSALTLKCQQPSLEVGREPLMTTLSHVSCVPRLPRHGGPWEGTVTSCRGGRYASGALVRVPREGAASACLSAKCPPHGGRLGRRALCGRSVFAVASHPRLRGSGEPGFCPLVNWGVSAPGEGAGGRGAGWQRAGPRQFLLLLSETLAVRRVPFH